MCARMGLPLLGAMQVEAFVSVEGGPYRLVVRVDNALILRDKYS